jgi:hypothetical protein
MWPTTSARHFRTSSASTRRTVAGVAVFVLWLAFLAAYGSGGLWCFDPATGRSGIDALDHCASHNPLGLNVAIRDTWPLASFLVVPPMLALIWWPHRPWRAVRRDDGLAHRHE